MAEQTFQLEDRECPTCQGLGLTLAWYDYETCERCWGCGKVEVQRVRHLADDSEFPEL